MKLTSFSARIRTALFAGLLALPAATSTFAQEGAQVAPPRPERQKTVRVVGIVRDENNAIALPGIPVQVVDTAQVVYTDVDGRYVLELAPGSHEIKVVMDGYQEKTIKVEAGAQRDVTLDVGLSMARYAETVTVTAQAI